MTITHAHNLLFTGQTRSCTLGSGYRQTEDTKDELRLASDSDTLTVGGTPTRDFAIVEALVRQDGLVRAHLEGPEREQLSEMEERDSLVERHEQAHHVAAGQYAIGGPQYKYQVGPNGKFYRVGGHVKIDTAPVAGDPEATIQKMKVVRHAALAPASFDELSSADHSVASLATRHMNTAQRELWEKQNDQLQRQAMTSPVLALF